VLTQSEIEERWLGGDRLDVDTQQLVDSFNMIERVLGRPWLEQSLAPGFVGPGIALPLHVFGEQLAVLEGADKKEKLVARLRNGDRAASSELHAIALCAPNDRVQIEIEPEIEVDGGRRVPDFRLRMPGEPWVHVEVTAPTASEAARAAQSTAKALAASVTLRWGTTIQVRFRREPELEDLDAVVRAIAAIEMDGVVDREMFIVHAYAATPDVSPIGNDENDRPIYAYMQGIIEGDKRAMIVVRVPYTDERAQQVIDAEARQLPKRGPGLIFVFTTYGKYWRGLIERSYSPSIRRRISGAVLFHNSIAIGVRGLRLATAGRLVSNAHARTPIPDWLRTHLEAIPLDY
jgi:hypothetical protein